MVCFSCYIWNISFVRELVPDLKKILPQVEFWAGGPEVSYDAVEFLKKNPAFFGVMVGEGEETFHELAGYYIERKPETLSGIRGVAFRDENKGRDIVHTGWRELMDLSKVPFAYSNLTEFKNRIIYYESSRGCPFSCSYCLSSIDKKLRFRDIELVKKELQFLLIIKFLRSNLWIVPSTASMTMPWRSGGILRRMITGSPIFILRFQQIFSVRRSWR